MSPTWPSWRRFSRTAKSSPSRVRSRTRPMSAARSRARPRRMRPRCIHEGLLVPPIKIWDGGQPSADIERHHPRQQPPARAGARRHARADRGHQDGRRRASRNSARASARETVTGRVRRHPQRRSRGLRAAIRRLPERHRLGRRIARQRRCRSRQTGQARRHGDDQGRIATFDFSNSAPQARGPINLRPSMIEACVFYALIGSLDPEAPIQ